MLFNIILLIVLLPLQAINKRLLKLDKTYEIFNQCEGQQLCETGRQLREKQILISFVGHLNVGKSTLLNTVLRARLVIIIVRVEFNSMS